MFLKSGKGKIVLIIILLLMVICLGSYIGYDKMQKPVEPKVIKEKIKVDALDVTSLEVVVSFSSVNDLSNNWMSEDYYGYLFKQDTLKVEDMSDELKTAVALYPEDKKCDESCYSGQTETIKGDNVKVQFEKTFGKIEYKPTDVKAFDCTGAYKYQDNNFVKQSHDCGTAGSSHDIYDYTIIKALKEENNLDIYVKVAFEYFEFNIEGDENGEVNKSTYTIYSDFGKQNKIDQILASEYDFNSVLNKYSDKLPVYKLHFEKEENDYSFKSVTKETN